jgi:hypothetical protein
LRVFLDCEDCFASFLRTEITWVDFVRQREDADVHLLSSSNDTGGGGREVVLRFVGASRFQGIDHTLRAVSLNGDTEDTRRRGVLRAVSVGLLGYLARAGLPADLTVSVRVAESDEPRPGARDPWNFWVFELSASASLDAEESNRQSSWDFSASADRVTERWILGFGAELDHETERFDLDEDEPLKVTRRERRAEWFAGKSLGAHWSFGIDGRLSSSTFGNTKFSLRSAPVVEFNVFPYAEHATRQLRLQYAIGVAHARYNEVTLFGRLR